MAITRSKLKEIKAGIDVSGGFQPPRDYTFMRLTSVAGNAFIWLVL